MKVFATVLSLVSAAVFAVLCDLLVWRDYGLWVISVSAAIFWRYLFRPFCTSSAICCSALCVK